MRECRRSSKPSLPITCVCQASIQQFAQLGCQLLECKRLGDEMEMRIEAAVMHDGIAGISGGEQDLQLGPQLHGSIGQHASIVAGQDHISEKQVDAVRSLEQLKGGFSVARLENTVAELFQ